jgi:hypothetical protein
LAAVKVEPTQKSPAETYRSARLYRVTTSSAARVGDQMLTG